MQMQSEYPKPSTDRSGVGSAVSIQIQSASKTSSFEYMVTAVEVEQNDKKAMFVTGINPRVTCT